MTMTEKQRLTMSKQRYDSYINRYETFRDLMNEHKIDIKTLAKQLDYNFLLNQLQAYYDGTSFIVRQASYDKLIKAINEIVKNKPNDDPIDQYNLSTLKRHGNVLLNKKHKKNLDNIKSFLSHLGLDCSACKDCGDSGIILFKESSNGMYYLCCNYCNCNTGINLRQKHNTKDVDK